MNFKKIAIAAMTAGVLFSQTAFAQEERARTVRELQQFVQQGVVRDREKNRQREAAFASNRADQQRLLNEANARKTALEQRSANLEEEFKNNEERLGELEEQLELRLGDLKELFGVIQQAAADSASDMKASVVNYQYPERVDYLNGLVRRMGSASDLPDLSDIDKLWQEMFREIAETGRVVKFSAPVVTADGEETTREVARVGGFNFASDGKYIEYKEETGKLADFVRQPDASRFIGSTSNLLDATSGQVGFGLDVTRGQVLASLVAKPSFRERLDQGGLVGYIIMGLGVLALIIALERLLVLTVAGGKVSSQVKSDTINTNNALGRVLKIAEDNKSANSETLELKLGEGILRETPKLNRGLVFLKIISVVAPLLGLLGTVTGMIKTFQQIMLFGTGDPSMMAGGISQALVTTAQGLAVAIPTVLLHTFVSGRAKKITHILQEQSAGIIAERSEKVG